MADPMPAERGISSRVVFPCDLQESRDATRMLRAFLAGQGLDESELFNIELCLAEACNNAVQHATGEAAQHPIVAEAICRDSSVELRVIDHTPGFELRAPAAPLPAERENGRGLFIMHALMDDVRYFRGAGSNTLVMRKTRTFQQHRSSEDSNVATLEDARRQLENCQQTIGGMARELCIRSESLSAIFRCCAELGRTSDLEGFANRLLNDLLHLTSADWFVLRLLPAGETRLVSFVVSSPDLRAEPMPIQRSTDPELPVELAVAITRTEREFDFRRAVAAVEPLCAAGVHAAGIVQPLLFGDKLVGTLAVGRRESDAPFSSLQAEMIRTFAEFMSVQIVNARHLEEQVHARLVAHELEIAHRIQRALLPPSLPQLANFDLAANWESARQVGGDFYDAIPLGERSVLLVVADVMGKGVPAAMFATIMRSLLRALAAAPGRSHQPAKLLKRLNELLYEELSSVGMFITAQLAVVDLDRRELVVASAGHCPLIVMSEGRVSSLRITGTPLGILPETKYRQQTATLAPRAGVLLYTDGLSESLDAAGDMFGHDRLAEWLRQSFTQPLSAAQLRDELATELNRFRGGTALRDDQAFLILAEQPLVPVPARAVSSPMEALAIV